MPPRHAVLLLCLLLAPRPGALPARAGEEGDAFTLEARVIAVSRVPNPRTSPYVECLFTVRVDPYLVSANPHPVILTLPGFTNRILTAAAALRPGDLLRATTREFDRMPDAYREQQLADDLGEVELPVLAATDPVRIDALLHPLAQPPWVHASVPRTLRVLTCPPAEVRARQERIDRDLSRIEALRAPHGEWKAWHDSLQPVRERLQARLDASPGGFIQDRHFLLADVRDSLGYTLDDNDPWYRHLLGSFVSLREQFARTGTDLLVVPIPLRDAVYAGKFADPRPADGVLQPHWLKFQHDLLRRGIEVVDLHDAYAAAMETSPLVYHAEVRDGHPGNDGAVLAARAIAERLRGYTFHTPRREYRLEPSTYRITTKDFYVPEGERYHPYTQVLETDGRPAAADAGSEILMIGDSMLTAPQEARSGSLGVHAAQQLGVPMAYFKRPGSAPLLSHHLSLVQDPSYFSGRRVCVFVFSAAYLAMRDRAWMGRPFLDLALERAHPVEAGAGLPVFADLRGADALSEWFLRAPSPATPTGVLLNPDPGQEVRLEFPPWLARAPADQAVVLEISTAQPGVWTVVRRSGRSESLAVPEGLARMGFTLDHDGPGWTGLVLPAGAPPATLHAARVHRAHATALPPPRSGDGGRLLARYNSADDYALLRIEPPGRAESHLLVLPATPASRTITLPAPDGPSPRTPDWLVLRAEADAPVWCEVLLDGERAGIYSVPAHPVDLLVRLSGPGTIAIRFPAGAPTVRVHEIELIDARPPAAPSP